MLRGHLVAEIMPFISSGKYEHALVIPANPSRNRVIKSGKYFVEGIELHKTLFSHDPVFPRLSAEVSDYLSGGEDAICIPDIESLADISLQLANTTPSDLICGAADAFSQLLKQLHLGHNVREPMRPTGTRLFICGSLAALESGRVEQAKSNHIDTIFLDAGYTSLIQQIRESFLKNSSIQVAYPFNINGQELESTALTSLFIERAWEITKLLQPAQVFIEGGATAQAFLDKLPNKLYAVVGEISPGIVAINSDNHISTVVIKPGSYKWPDLGHL